MSPDPFPCPSEQGETSRGVIERALAGMFVAELVDLRMTAQRFKHLPFTRLVEALFLQSRDRGEGSVEKGAESQEYNFAGDSSEHCRSEYVRTLLQQIEEAIAAKTTP